MKRRILSATVLTLVILLILAIPASATKGIEVSGDMMYAAPPENLVFQYADNTCILDVDLPYQFTGNLVGIATLHWRVVSHGPCPVGPFQYNENLKARGTFVGTVDGKEGSFDLIFVGKSWPVASGELALTANIVILSGTGGLANLHG
jgi:hypothetical protein